MAKVTPVFPRKRVDGYLWGILNCETGYSGDTAWQPTNGTGSFPTVQCSPAFPSARTASTRNVNDPSNQLAYVLGANPTGTPYTMQIGPDFALYTYPQDLKTYGAGNTRMDAWKAYWIDGFFDKYNIKWTLALDQIIQYGAFAIPGIGTVGQTSYQTPGFDTSYYTPSSGQCSSYEAVYGPALDFIESKCGKNFEGYHFEAVYPNCVEWLHNRTNYWVIVKNYGGWTADGNYMKHWTWTGPNTGTMTNWATPSWPATTMNPMFNYVDEIIIELMYADMPVAMKGWLDERNKFSPQTKIGMNIDHPMRCLSHAMATYSCNEGVGGNAYWCEAAKGTTFNGQTVDRNWWEGLYALQICNWFIENYGPFDSFIFNPLTAVWPANDTPDLIWYLNWIENLYALNSINRVNVTVS